jgi:hypothetical protein
MKKLLVGCLAIVVLGVVALGVGAYFVYRAATPYIEDARAALRGLSELGELDKDIKNKTAHTPPQSGELTDAQLQRFARVQDHVRTTLGQRMKEFETRYEHLKSQNQGGAQPSFTETMAALRDLANVFLDARRYQVDALNSEGFSQSEYAWVRNRVFEAAGIEAANMIDLGQLERAVREGTGMEDFRAPRVPTRDVPEKNRALVKPYLKQMDEWIPLAFFGL